MVALPPNRHRRHKEHPGLPLSHPGTGAKRVAGQDRPGRDVMWCLPRLLANLLWCRYPLAIVRLWAAHTCCSSGVDGRAVGLRSRARQYFERKKKVELICGWDYNDDLRKDKGVLEMPGRPISK